MVSLGKAGYLVEENAKNPGVLKTMAESRIGCFPLLFALENRGKSVLFLPRPQRSARTMKCATPPRIKPSASNPRRDARKTKPEKTREPELYPGHLSLFLDPIKL